MFLSSADVQYCFNSVSQFCGNRSLLYTCSEQPCQCGHLPLNPGTLTIENKPVTISGNPSKPPNDNIKTKLKNNSTPTTQEACGRASITSQILKGINQLQ